MINFYLDELVPCLKDTKTGEIFETEVVKLKRKSFLKKFNKSTGWYVDWSKFSDDIDIYGLVLKGSLEIQGLIALKVDKDIKSVYIAWGCVAPQNNIWQYGKKKYSGVGGHLFALASEISKNNGCDGYIHAEAIDEELLNYYCSEFNAIPLPAISLNPYHFMLDEEATSKIREVYTYEWTEVIL